MRLDGRVNDQLREIRITKGYTKYAEGSVLIEAGGTKVLCNATIDERVPPFIKGSGKGWVTAEYAMLPRSTHVRNQRESMRGRVGGRTFEIQRLIGRALRCVVDLESLGERTVIIDCDVLQADGGTRTAAITGAYVALSCAVQRLLNKGVLETMPITDSVAAVSVGIINGDAMLDLNFEEDSQADVDMNVVMTGRGEFVELQGTAEKRAFNNDQLQSMLDIAMKGIKKLTDKQNEILKIETQN